MGPVLTSEEESSTSFQTQKPLARTNHFYGLFALVAVCMGIVTFAFYRYTTKNAVDPVGWKLVVSPSGRRVLISKTTILIGRDSSCNIMLQGDYVSQRHAELSIRRGELWLKDLNSKNGMKVNGQLVEARRLDAEDSIDIAGNVFRVEMSG